MSRKTDKIKGLKYPQADKISTRRSTVARSMASTLMPRIKINEDDDEDIIAKWMKYLYGDNVRNPISCVYCGSSPEKLELDHLFPLIRNQQPSGYCTELVNLVPCCRECNGSKGSKLWWKYMDMNEYDESNESQKKIKQRLESKRKDADGNIIDSLELRFKKLKDYCSKFGLPSSDSEFESERNEHKICFNDSALTWWKDLYDEVVVTLNSAQIQIDAFNAGIKDSVNNKKNGFNLFYQGLFTARSTERLNELGLYEAFNKIDDINDDKAKHIYEEALKAYRIGFEYAKNQQNDNLLTKWYKES